jgi:hypothetical protein
VPDFRIDLVSVTYDPDNESFDVTASAALPIRPGYSYEWFDGSSWHSGTDQSAVIASTPRLTLVEGSNTDLVYNGVPPMPFTLQVEIKANGCP